MAEKRSEASIATTRNDDCVPTIIIPLNTAGAKTSRAETIMGTSFDSTINETLSVSAMAKLVMKTLAGLRKRLRGSLYRTNNSNMFIRKPTKPRTITVMLREFTGTRRGIRNSNDELKLKLKSPGLRRGAILNVYPVFVNHL